MFDVGGGELFLIFIVVLLLFGPKKIPEVMRSVGKGLRQFRQAQEDLKQQLRDISAEVEQSAEIRTVRPALSFTSSAIDENEPTKTSELGIDEKDKEKENSAESSSAESHAQPVPRQMKTTVDSSASSIENS